MNEKEAGIGPLQKQAAVGWYSADVIGLRTHEAFRPRATRKLEGTID